MSQSTSPTQPARILGAARKCCPKLLTVILALVMAPAVASGETPITPQAEADHGAFLAYAPPPPQRAGMCLVDTGVNINPDSESTVVERTAIDGASGNDVSPTQHGTVLAMMASAPPNGWGMTGTAPTSIQIVSVRILAAGQTTFPFTDYATGINACLQMRTRFDIKTINLSLGSSEMPSSKNYEAVQNAIEEAGSYGVAVVAATGNDDGGAIGYPAAYQGVLSVAAGDALTGGFCSFSNRGSGLRLIAPGCDLEGADPSSGSASFNYWQGTSEASAIAASALTALMAYRPELTAQAAEQDITEADIASLDIAQAFRNAGLGQLVSEGETAEPHPPTSIPAVPPASPPQGLQPSPTTPMPATTQTPFPVPRAQLTRHNRHLLLVLGGRPGDAQAEVRYLARRGHSRQLRVLRTIIGRFATLTIPTTGVLELAIRYTDPYDIRRSSPWTTLRLPNPASHRR